MYMYVASTVVCIHITPKNEHEFSCSSIYTLCYPSPSFHSQFNPSTIVIPVYS